ncbi:conserved hypothetical protein [Acidithiobacillus caldus SM-1]|jgi:hypothetical protein|uniref:Uncharacterized protein n=2 Tax=Acidithiobacillus caldus TaxID=33059 RepID=F9ZRD4_ACICS|nr:conserved hypothetical protein [Acidithiobacillus caldus SM-1]QER44199.1 hypothetical protein F0726_01122 [Acidithiobacillus caldus]
MHYTDLESIIFFLPFVYFSFAGVMYLYTRKRFK